MKELKEDELIGKVIQINGATSPADNKPFDIEVKEVVFAYNRAMAIINNKFVISLQEYSDLLATNH